MKTTLAFAAAALTWTNVAPDFASAQTTGGFFPAPETHRNYQSPPTFYHHASTEAEGYFRGAADVIRARGESAYNHALAANLAEEAYARSLQNRVLRAETFHSMRALNRQQRFPAVDPAAAAARRERVAAWGRPAGLTASQYRAELGQLIWPEVLREPLFDNERREIDVLVRQSMAGYADEITQLVRRMEDQLDANIHTVGQESYLAGTRFLRSLMREVRESARGVAVAAR